MLQITSYEHGSPFDRGSADSYYGRPKAPHYYPQGTYFGEPVTDLTPLQVREYMEGYEWNQQFGGKKIY